MVVILSYFDKKMGPRVYMTHPMLEITDEVEHNISKDMDLKEGEGFVDTTDSIRSMSYLFIIPSVLGRGKSETVMLSYIITETEPNVDLCKKRLKEAADKIKDFPASYLGFYEGEKGYELAMRKFREILTELDNSLRMRDINTIGYLSDLGLFEKGYIPAPNVFRDRADELEEDAKSYLLIYKRNVDGSWALKGYPIYTNKVYKMTIFTDQMDIAIMNIVKQGFRNYINTKTPYSSGLCQQEKVCSYEMYFEFDGKEEKLHELNEFLTKNIRAHNQFYPAVTWEEIPIEDPPIIVDESLISSRHIPRSIATQRDQ